MRSSVPIILPSIILSKIQALLFIILFLGSAPVVRAADAAPAPARSQRVSPVELDRAIEQVIQQRKYTWRLPRKELSMPADEPGILARFFKRVGHLIRDGLKATLEWLADLLKRLFSGWSPPGVGPLPDFNWYQLSQILLYVLVTVVLSAAGILLFRMWRNRRRNPEILQTEAIQPVPDLTDENVGADQLPEDGWTKLARELLARGEFRLALRAFYLASLAHLAERNLISLARFKSNHDYELELGRRAHSFPSLLQVFGENVGAFDRVWYGRHEASGELVTQFAANVERIKAGG